jgi:HlyD family secretion protein
MDETARLQPQIEPTPRPLAPGTSRPWRARRHWLWAAASAALLFLAAAITGLWWSYSEAPVRYTTATVSRGPIVRAISASGTVNPVLTIIVGSYVSGVIQDISCDYNTVVKKGQLCAKIDPRPYQTVVDQNKANLAVAFAQLEKDKANLAYTKLNFDRNRRLAEQKSVAQDTADLAKNAYEQAQAQVGLDQATIEQRHAQLEAAQVNLGYTDIVSPVDGTVVSRNVTIGQTVAASFQTPTLFLIATDLTKMQVDVNVSESDIGSVKEGNKASFTVESFSDRAFEGDVLQVRQAPQSVQNVVTYDVVIAADNAASLLKPGMTATSRIITAQRDEALRVPDQALRYVPSGVIPTAVTPGSGQVWVLRDGRPAQVALKLGLDDDTYSEVLEGDLHPGDTLILSEQRGTAAGGASQSRPRLFF